MFEVGYGCDQGYSWTRIRVDDGTDGGTAGDGVLQEGEIDSAFATCLANDHDNDGIDNMLDNCPEIGNAAQADADYDGVGDDCDASADAAMAYGISRGSGGANSNLYEVDAIAGSATLIGDTGYALISLQVDPSDGTLYGITRPWNSGGCDSCLVTIDTATGAATSVAELEADVVPALGITPDGDFIGFTEDEDVIISIDPATGAVTWTDMYANSYGHSMGVTADGTIMWMNGDGAVYDVDMDEEVLDLWYELSDEDGISDAWSPIYGDYGIRGDISQDGRFWIGSEVTYGDGTPKLVMYDLHPGLSPSLDYAVEMTESIYFVTWAN